MRGTLVRMQRRRKEPSESDQDMSLAVVSHELRNQINAIRGWAELIRRAATDGATLAHGLEVIECNANLQARLIEQLIHLSRVRINCLNPKTQKISLASIIEVARDSMMPLASEKRIEVDFRIDDSKCVVNADAGLMQQALTNILGNAIKFTPAGGRIDLQLTTRGTCAEISVSDTGCGVPRDLLPLIFEPFKQVHADQGNGLGLGLTITQHIIAAHDGTICASSPGEGKGTIFTIKLPLLSH